MYHGWMKEKIDGVGNKGVFFGAKRLFCSFFTCFKVDESRFLLELLADYAPEYVLCHNAFAFIIMMRRSGLLSKATALLIPFLLHSRFRLHIP